MNSTLLGLRVAGTIFGLAALAHLTRLLMPFSVMIGSHTLPVWVSGPGLLITGLLSYWLWSLSLPARPAAGAPPPATN